ncbi:hypothetical protein EVAR_91204_1 [Eumeta japonica]|uniref:RNase H type-1 domain-containing protein n=1 Tax=Eumeta variegata TaxID=151549 RepID=A0A4C1ZLQ4_EUMVA|nr:hypothetical protein EVAR_91204_1 [Eumeta japonica]
MERAQFMPPKTKIIFFKRKQKYDLLIVRRCVVLGSGFSDEQEPSRHAAKRFCEQNLQIVSRENVREIRAEGGNVKLFWLNTHIGTLGNEKADEFAKAAALRFDSPLAYDNVALSYVKKKCSTLVCFQVPEQISNVKHRGNHWTVSPECGISVLCHFVLRMTVPASVMQRTKRLWSHVLLKCLRFLAACIHVEHQIEKDNTLGTIPNVHEAEKLA